MSQFDNNSSLRASKKYVNLQVWEVNGDIKNKKISRGRVERPISRFRSDKLQSCALNQLGYREYLIVEERVYYITHIQLKKGS